MMNSVANGVASEQEDDVKDYFVGFVSDRAKPCVDKAIDYTLLVVTLALQYFRCEELEFSSPDPECNFGSNWINFSELKYLKVLIWVLIGIGLFYGIIVSILIWMHSAFIPDMKLHPRTEKLYRCTDRIFLVDSILEIPVAFVKTPIITTLLWSFYVFALGGLYFLTMKYSELVMDEEVKDMNAKNVFISSAVLVAISLYKFTGEVSQYWVLYKTSVKYTREDKENREDMSDMSDTSKKSKRKKLKAKNFDKEDKDEENLEFLSNKQFNHSTFDDEEEGATVGSD